MTESKVEIDLVVERPGQSNLFIKIKSTDSVKQEDLTAMQKIITDFGTCEAVCLSRDPRKKKIGDIVVYPWAIGIKKFFR